MSGHMDARWFEQHQQRTRQLAAMTRTELDQAALTDGPKLMGLLRTQWDLQIQPTMLALRDISLLLSHLELRGATRLDVIKGTTVEELRRARAVLFAVRAMSDATPPMLEGLEALFLRIAAASKEVH